MVLLYAHTVAVMRLHPSKKKTIASSNLEINLFWVCTSTWNLNCLFVWVFVPFVIGQNLQPLTGNGDVSIEVKTFRVGLKKHGQTIKTRTKYIFKSLSRTLKRTKPSFICYYWYQHAFSIMVALCFQTYFVKLYCV